MDGTINSYKKKLTTQPQPQVHIKQEGANVITQNHVECQQLDPITSLRSSSSLTIAYEQFAGNIRQTTSKAELVMYHHTAIVLPLRNLSSG